MKALIQIARDEWWVLATIAAAFVGILIWNGIGILDAINGMVITIFWSAVILGLPTLLIESIRRKRR